MVGFTQVGADTSFWFLGGCQFLMGLGMGATMMPAMSAAYQTLQRQQLARATTALNIIQRVGGSIGTALLSVVLTHQLTSAIPAADGGGLAAAQSVPAAERAQIAPAIADAFGHTFWWAAGIIALAIIPALMLPRHKAQAPATPAGEQTPAEAARPRRGLRPRPHVEHDLARRTAAVDELQRIGGPVQREAPRRRSAARSRRRSARRAPRRSRGSRRAWT